MSIYKTISYRRLILGAVAVLFLGFLQSCHDASQTQQVVRFGVEADVPPFESRNEKGELVGLDIDIGNALCAQMNARCEWVDQPYATNISALLENRFDAIMPMTPNDVRRQQIDFTDEMYPLSSQLVARKGSNLLPTAASLQGKRVGVLRGTSREAFSQARWASAGVNIVSFGLNSELIASLIAGDIDATLQNTIEIAEALLKKPEGSNFDFSGPTVTDPLLGSGVAMGVRKSDPGLKAKLNEALAAIKENGVLKEILARYLTSPTVSGSSLQYIGGDASLPFSQAVRAGNILYLSGILGNYDNGGFPEGTAAQTAVIMDKIRAVLERNGSSLDRVIQCKVILADIADFAEMNKVYASYFSPGRFPARTTFATSGLVANADIEIECMAYVE